MTNSSEYLSSVRQLLFEKGIDAFIVTSSDCHQSEYVQAYDLRRQFVSGFTGSSGTALILQDKAYLWTDGRYYLQASQELSNEWILMKQGMTGVLELDQWLIQNLSPNTVVGVDASLFSTQQALVLQDLLRSHNMKLEAIDNNPIDIVWNESGTRPLKSSNPIQLHPLEFSGQTYQEKISILQGHIKENNSYGLVISSLDEIAWLLNIRGSDIQYNPVVISYVVVTLSKAYLFIDESKISEDIRPYFSDDIVKILPYESIDEFLKDITTNNDLKTTNHIIVDTALLNWRLYLILGKYAKSLKSIITILKSIKNEKELNGMKTAHVRDGVALTAFLCWLENKVLFDTSSNFTEYDATLKIEEFRSKMPRHVSPSFSTICGSGANGAIIHYKPELDTCKIIDSSKILLLDSGAQYLDGTTDCTRTIMFNDVSDHIKYCYTLVLKGHIALASLVFPDGTLGSRLDATARIPLWTAGLDYNHGTGHGVGAFLNVHEGPQGIGFRFRPNEGGLQCGMTISNEPGM